MSPGMELRQVEHLIMGVAMGLALISHMGRNVLKDSENVSYTLTSAEVITAYL